MSIRVLLATLAVVAVPIAVHGAEPQTQQQKVSPEKKVCRVESESGSRLGAVRVCRTASEAEQMRQERRRVIDRIQNNKVSFGK